MKRTITVYKALFCDMTDNHCRGFAIVALLFIFSIHNGNYHKESHTTSMCTSFLSNTVYSINAVLMCLVLPVIYVVIILIGTGIFTTSTPIEAPWTLLWEWIIVWVFRFTIKNCLKNNIKSCFYPLYELLIGLNEFRINNVNFALPQFTCKNAGVCNSRFPPG